MKPRSPWWLIAGVFVVLSMSSGFGFHNLSVYMNALVAERSFSVADVSTAVALLFVVSGVAGVVVGRLIERHDVRMVMVAGAVIGAVALGLIGFAREVWQVWVLYAVFGVGNSGVSLVPATTVVTRWFPGANRSIAMSIASTGLSAGGVLLAPASAQAIHFFGVATAMPWFAVVYLAVIAPTALLLVRSWPPGSSIARAPVQRDLGGDLYSRFFIGATIAYVALMAAQVGGIAHLFNHVATVTDHIVGSTAVSLLALMSIGGRLLGGFLLAAGFPIRVLTGISLAIQGLGLGVLGYAQTPVTSLLGTAVFGLSVGNLLMLQPLLLVQAFGVQHYPRLFAVSHACSTIGVAGGPLAMGIIHDASSYAGSFGAAAVASAAALVVFIAAGALPRVPDAVVVPADPIRRR